ncbi:hypothetical protein BJV78DRAFT_175191 [Lactifluus subvellereus]|nr:hypothetical protein BJV78DRAFT_175191 [Lactifluus subvellereus]
MKVHRAPNGTYEGALAVLSPDLVLFLKRKTPSIELCRVTLGGRGGTDGASGRSSPSLHVVCTLALPAFHPDCRVHTAYMQTDRHCERRPRTTTTTSAAAAAAAIQRRQRHQEREQGQEEEEQGEEQPARLPFHSAPEDMVVGITFLLRKRGPHAIWKKVVTTISHRALFALASTFDDPPTQNDSDGSEGDGEEDAEDAEEEGEEGGEEEEVPWEEWGPSAARVIAPPTFQWITAYAGQRWLSLECDNKLVIRDFSAARVCRASVRARARRRQTSAELRGNHTHHHHHNNNNNYNNNNNGNDNGPGHRRRDSAKGSGGWSSGCFAEDVVSGLPFLETRVPVDVPGRAGAMVLTDGERLVAFVRSVSLTATLREPY